MYRALVVSSVLHIFRGRVIPADLEAKIIDAKQKVSVCLFTSYNGIFASFCAFLSHRDCDIWSCVWTLQGYVPLFVNATAGSTVYGAFDPINEIADICEKYNLWLHVDASIYVGSVAAVFSSGRSYTANLSA